MEITLSYQMSNHESAILNSLEKERYYKEIINIANTQFSPKSENSHEVWQKNNDCILPQMVSYRVTRANNCIDAGLEHQSNISLDRLKLGE